MARPRKTVELKDGQIGLTGEQMFLVMKALDVYAYSLMASQSIEELQQVQAIAKEFVKNAPKMELDS